jgi:hypothetical protein
MSRVRGFATSSLGALYTLLGGISDGGVSKNACQGWVVKGSASALCVIAAWL